MTQADGGFMGSGFVCPTPPNKKRENVHDSVRHRLSYRTDIADRSEAYSRIWSASHAEMTIGACVHRGGRRGGWWDAKRALSEQECVALRESPDFG